jgi:hypothetical protein
MQADWACLNVRKRCVASLQNLGGWESVEMMRRYAHLVADHLAPYADRLRSLIVSGAEISGHVLGTAEKSGSLARS